LSSGSVELEWTLALAQACRLSATTNTMVIWS
jgi:hypothetical protein